MMPLRIREIRRRRLSGKTILKILRITETERTGMAEKTEETGTTETIGTIEPAGITGTTEITGITTETITETTEITTEKIEITEGRETMAARETGRAVSQEEAAAKITDTRATGKMDIREVAGLVLRITKMIAVVRALLRAADVISTVVHAMAEAMADREPDTEIINRARDLWEKRPQRTWKRSVRKTRGAQTARKRINAPGKITFTRKRIL